MRYLFLMAFLFFSLSKGFCLDLTNPVLFFRNGTVTTSVYLKRVPFQLLDACLKSGDSPIEFTYDFKIYRHRFLLPDVLKFEKQVNFKVIYDKEENLYVVKWNKWRWKFYIPEKALLKACKVDSVILPYLLNKKEDLYIKVKVRIRFKCHLTEDLDYTEGLNDYEFDAETSRSL